MQFNKKEFLDRVTAGGKLFFMSTIKGLESKNDHLFKNVSSPFRRDSNPSFQIFHNRDINKWYYHDYGESNSCGDMYAFAAKIYGLDFKKQFPELIEKMCEVLEVDKMDSNEIEKLMKGLDGTTDTKYYNLRIPNIIISSQFNSEDNVKDEPEQECREVRIQKKSESELSNEEKKWLELTSIDYKVMLKYNTYFISGYCKIDSDGMAFDIKKKPKNSIWVCYDFGGFYKIYNPKPKRFWFIGTKKGLRDFGTPTINFSFDKPTIVYLAAGEKDTLVLLSNSYQAMCLNSESASLSDQKEFSWRTKGNYKVVVIYDNDLTGIRESKKLNDQYNLPFIILPNWLKEKGGKDIADFFAMGGTKEELDSLTMDALNQVPIISKTNTQRLSVRTATQRLMDARSIPDILPHADVLFQTNELTILFGDTGKGKSIFAVGLADAISKGTSFMGLDNKCEPLTVLFYDFELSDKQFQKRYSDADGVAYYFSNNLFIDNFDLSSIDLSDRKVTFEEELMNKIRLDLNATGAKVLIIDNITFLTAFSTEDGQVAMKLMKLLKELKTKEGISVLVLAHTPKRFGLGGITSMDIAGSKHLSNFADSVMALGASKKDPNLRYIIQTKASRTGEIKYDVENVIVCEIEKDGSFLSLAFKGYDREQEHLSAISGEVQDEMRQKAMELKKRGKSYQMIADELGTSKSTVGRWLTPPIPSDN